MKEQPLVSIPMITYNGEEYLEEQLDSIYNQTYKNIEVLVFDDCSTDKTSEILEKYHKSHNLTYVINKNNLGLRRNAIKSLEACSGEFIAPADQDDVWKSKKIELLVNNIEDNILIYADSTSIDPNGNILEERYFEKFRDLIHGNNNKAFFFMNCVSAHAMLFKKELLEFIFPMPKRMFYHDWWIAFVASTYGSIKLYEEPLVLYRRHEHQLTINKIKEHRLPGKGWLQRRIEKENYLKEERYKILDILYSLSTLRILDKETLQLLNKLIYNIEKFSSTLHNKELTKILKQHKEEIFQMDKDKRFSRSIKKLSRGLWHYRLKFYT